MARRNTATMNSTFKTEFGESTNTTSVDESHVDFDLNDVTSSAFGGGATSIAHGSSNMASSSTTPNNLMADYSLDMKYDWVSF